MIGLPIGILFYSDDPLVKDSAKEALNFIISQVIWSIIFIVACMTVIGIPVGVGGFWLLGIVTLVLPIVAIASVIADPDKPFRYPFTFRLIPSGTPQLTQQDSVV